MVDILKLVSTDLSIFHSIHRTAESRLGEPVGPSPVPPTRRLLGVSFSGLHTLLHELSAPLSRAHGMRDKRSNVGMSQRQGLRAVTPFYSLTSLEDTISHNLPVCQGFSGSGQVSAKFPRTLDS